MTPVDQTRFYEPDKGLRGNCLQAALASLLDFPLAAVPNFAEHGGDWHEVLLTWLEWLGLDLDPFAPQIVPKGFAIANGPSPRGIRHSVIVHDGVLAHDPHPSRAGLLSIDQFWVLVTLPTD